MKTQFTLLFTILLLIVSNAQEKMITGTVTTALDGLPLPGVNIIIKGTSTGTQTDLDGKYQLKANVGDIIIANYLGYKSVEVNIDTSNIYNIAMQEDSEMLEEVIVTAQSARREQKSLGYAVTTVKSESVKNRKRRKRLNESPTQLLQGMASGVNITTANGYVGSNTTIKIRGISSVNSNSEPLFIVDGNPVNERNFKTLNPNNIKSINVIKDFKATAIYGSRGANGVVVITTKNGYKPVNSNITYIVDGVVIQKKNNAVVEAISKADIESKIVYNGNQAKQKFGKAFKEGCIVITTHKGNFRIQNNESYVAINENPFESTTLSPLSTFSIDVDKAAYSNVRRMINNGETVNPEAVKIEEMVNYFNYSYPQPKDKHPFSINTEVVATPWNNNTQLVRIGLQGKTYDNEALPASNLTFLIDVSGSMSSPNKLPLLKSAFKLLVNQLRAKDKVSIVVYAGAAGVVLEPTSGDNKNRIISALDELQSGGSTAGGAGIELAYKLAEKHFVKNGNNRVILATDGDFNVGASSDKVMQTLIEDKRKSGVFLSVLGFGYGNYKDSKLETLADKGNGNHAYIDSMQEAQKVFGKEFGGTLYTIAKDVKIQMEFNPNKVQAYRLIGYENRLLNDEDFVDDKIDAGELGSGHTVTALYELIPVGTESKFLKDVPKLKYTNTEKTANYNDELFTVKFRYKQPIGSKSIEMIHVQPDSLSKPSEDMHFASAVALFGMQLRQSRYANDTDKNLVLNLAKAGRSKDEEGYRAEFIRLVKSYEMNYNISVVAN